MVRTGRHRALAPGSRAVSALRVLATAQTRAIRQRTRAVHQLRACLATSYPAAITAWPRHTKLRHPQARAILALAPTPAAAAALTRSQIAAALQRAGRWRTVDDEAERLQSHFRHPSLRTHPTIEVGLGEHRYSGWR
ncbi:hypothetical protein [Streptomyces sedi]|uniref:hypothetical protein n=1 Tax=Streptomyces sedi TaxID=555059 RepID=UPI001476A8E9